MGLTTTSGLSIGGGLSLGSGLSRGSGLVEIGTSGASVVAAYAAAVATNGGTVSSARQAILTTFFTAEIASGAYALTDDYWGLWAEDAPGALTSMKQRRLATVIAAPTFTASRGYVFNGTTQAIDTGFIPGTHAVSMSLGNQRMAVYERTNVNSANTSMSASIGGSMRHTARNGANITAITSAPSVTIPLSPADSSALTSSSRAGNGTTVNGYQRGVKLAAQTTSGSTALATVSVYLSANNNGSGGNIFRAASLGFACIGNALSDAQELAQYNAVQAWATSIGANV